MLTVFANIALMVVVTTTMTALVVLGRSTDPAFWR